MINIISKFIGKPDFWACQTRNEKILQASTLEAFAGPSKHPQTLSHWGRLYSLGIRSYYDECKRCAETLFLDYKRQYHLNIKNNYILGS
jgi:UDP-glucuronate decarboxylase